jgi:5'-nucleotidase
VPQRREDQLVIGVASDALFDLAGLSERAADPLRPGLAFSLIKTWLQLNRSPVEGLIEVVLVSRTDAASGLHIMNAARHHGLDVERAAFTGGRDPYPHLTVLGCHLFLSADEAEVLGARRAGIAAGLISPSAGESGEAENEIRIVFDGDAALFADHSATGSSNQEPAADRPLRARAIPRLLASLGAIQQAFPLETCPLRTAVFTTRKSPADQEVIASLRTWNLRVDESFLLRGDERRMVLEVVRPHLFFEDQISYSSSAAAVVPTAPTDR